MHTYPFTIEQIISFSRLSNFELKKIIIQKVGERLRAYASLKNEQEYSTWQKISQLTNELNALWDIQTEVSRARKKSLTLPTQ